MLTWLILSVAGQKENFKTDIMISAIVTTDFTINIVKIFLLLCFSVFIYSCIKISFLMRNV